MKDHTLGALKEEEIFISQFFFFFVLFCFFCLFASSRAALTAYAASQARGLVGAIAASLHHSHSNARSELHL